MSQFPQIKIQHSIGNRIEIPNQIQVKASTYISNNIASAVSSIPVVNAINFSPNPPLFVLLLSSFGSENAEFVVCSAHTNVSLTVFSSTTQMPHSRGELVQEIVFNAVEVYKSSTINGTYTIFSTLTFNPTQGESVILDPLGLDTDFYKVRWKNMASLSVSDFSDPISVLTYPENSVANIINPVLTAMGISENDKYITTQFCLSAIDDARRYTDAELFGIRHAWREKFEYPLKVLAGSNYVLLPTDIDFNMTDQSLLATRFMRGNVLAPFNLSYIDKRSWNQLSWQATGGITTVLANIAATTLTLNSVGDFPASGVAYVATDAFNQVIMQIAYTGVNMVTNQLTGVTGVTRAIPLGTQIWITPLLNQPTVYSVWDKKIYFDRIIPDSMQGNNCYIDYYKKLDKVETLYQELPERYREIYRWYLRWAIKYRKDITLPTNDPDLVKFEGLVKALFNNLYTGQSTTIITS